MTEKAKKTEKEEKKAIKNTDFQVPFLEAPDHFIAAKLGIEVHRVVVAKNSGCKDYEQAADFLGL